MVAGSPVRKTPRLYFRVGINVTLLYARGNRRLSRFRSSQLAILSDAPRRRRLGSF